MIDNTDVNDFLIDSILITTDEQALFLSKKLQEDVVLSNTMKEALDMYSKLMEEK